MNWNRQANTIKYSWLLVGILLLVAAGVVGAQGIEVSGSVNDQGKAVPGATWSLYEHESAWDHAHRWMKLTEPQTPVASGRTDARGSFTIRNAEPGFYHLRVEKEGFLPMALRLLPLLEDRALPPLELTEAVDLVATIEDPAGQGASGAWAQLLQRSSSSASRRGRDGRNSAPRNPWSPERWMRKADGSGVVHFSVGAEEEFTLRAWAPDHVVQEVGFRGLRRTDAPHSQIRLTPSTQRMLRVVDSENRAVANALIRVGPGGFPQGFTDAEGRIKVSGHPESILLVTATIEDGRSAMTRQSPEIPRQGDYLAFEDQSPLDGRVLDIETGDAVPEALIWIGRRMDRWIRTDRSGGFRLSADHDSRRVQVAATGYFQESTAPEINGGVFQPVSVALQPAVVLTGIVVDEEGEAIEEVEIVPTMALKGIGQAPRGFRFRNRTPPTQSGPKGRFRLEPLVPSSNYSVKFQHGDFAAHQENWVPPSSTAEARELRVVLSKGHQTVGRVVDADGLPVVGASVKLFLESEGFLQAFGVGKEPILKESFSGEEGGYSFEKLAVGAYRLVVKASGYSSEIVRGLTISRSESLGDWGEVELREGVALRAKVEDADGKLVAGVEVWTLDEKMPFIGNLFTEAAGPAAAVSGADGFFQIDDRREGEKVDLLLSKDGYAVLRKEGFTLPLKEELVLVLQPASAIRGQVLGESGEGLESVRVQIGRRRSVGFQTMDMEFDETTSAEDGSFEIDGLGEGNYYLKAQSEDYQEAKLDGLEVLAGQNLEEIQLTLKRGFRIDGRVINAADEAVPGVNLNVQRTGGGLIPQPLAQARADAEGRFRFKGLPPGRLVVTARHPSYPELKQEVEISEDDLETVLAFEASWTVSGRVLVAGEGVSGAFVKVQQGLAMMRGKSKQADTDPTGTFEIKGVGQGTWVVVAGAEGYADTQLPEPITVENSDLAGVVIELQAGVAVVGEVLGLDSPALSELKLFAFTMASAANPRTGVLGSDGRYRIDNLTPGTWMVMGQVPSTSQLLQKSVTLEAGVDEVVQDLDFRKGYRLSGWVSRDGEGVAGVQLTMTAMEGGGSFGSARSDSEGRFVVEGVKASKYRLHAETDSGLTHDEEVEVEGDTEVNIELVSARLSGYVLDSEEGSPLEGVVIHLDSAAGSAIPSVFGNQKTDSTGFFLFPETGAGSWTLRLTLAGYEPLEQALELVPGESLENLDLRMEKRELFRLRLRSSSGPVPSFVVVAALGAAGEAFPSALLRVGPEGWLELDELPEGHWNLVLAGREFAVAETAVSPGTTAELTLHPAARLRVQVPELMVTEEDAMVVLHRADGRALRVPEFPKGVREQIPLPAGQTVLNGLPAGSWSITVTTADGRRWTADVALAARAQAEVVLE